jgi:hypothetical protein
MNLSFSILRDRGMLYKFIDESTEVPEGSQYLWDFGDLTNSTLKNPEKRYTEIGEYTIKLRVTSPDTPPEINGGDIIPGETIEVSQLLIIRTRTALSKPLIDVAKTYIPEILITDFEANQGQYMDKWQLYIQPLVKHEVPEEYYFDETYYEALENQLIAELVVYDYFVAALSKYLATTIANGSNAIASDDGDTETSDGEVKKIVTGPTEAEFFSSAENSAKLIKALEGISKVGGTLDMLRSEVCQLAHRLDIYLPMCGIPNKIVKSPEVLRYGLRDNTGQLRR